MKHLVVILFGTLLLQGCISLPKDEMYVFDRIPSGEGLQFFGSSLPVTISYDSNYNTAEAEQMAKYRQRVLNDTVEYFAERGVLVVDLTNQPIKPSEYLDITLIVDRPVQDRAEDKIAWQKISGFASLLTLGIIPSIGSETDTYLILKRIKFNKVDHETRLTKASRLYKSVLFLPAWPFFTQNKSISKSYLEMLDSTFALEVIK